MTNFFPVAHLLIPWFRVASRQLPWRMVRDPYTVLVSEVMLQQTQVSRVLEYFSRWMDQFPTLESLASSSEDDVIKAWEGLGYYSRARSLRKAAQYIQSQFHGVVPSQKELLLSIPGIGDYTEGAIRSFAFHAKAAAVDANVLRVLSRLYDLPLGHDLSSYAKARECVLSVLPDHEPWVCMEAFIELGALVCLKKAKCDLCPLIGCCRAFNHKTIQERPLPKKKVERLYEKRRLLVFQKEERFCVIKRQGRAAMSGLWEFPYVAYDIPFEEKWPSCALKTVQHSYTRYVVTLYPVLFSVPDSFSWHEGEWVQREQLSSLAFSSGHRRVAKQFFSRSKRYL